MELCKLTENEISKFLILSAKTFGEKAPRCVTVTREQKRNSITRTIRFALVTTSNNEELLDFLVRECLEKDEELYFVGSQVNLQGDLEMDYLYFEAKIFAKKQ